MALPRITKEDLKQTLETADDSAKPVLVDARLKYPFEHSTVKLPDAVRVTPHGAAGETLPKNRTVVVYCSDPNEITSGAVGADLVRQGYRVQVLKGGIAEWIGASLPTEPRIPVAPAPPEA